MTVKIRPYRKGGWEVEFEAVVRGASKVDHRALLVVLLGGEAGLRSGEIRGAGVDVDRLPAADADGATDEPASLTRHSLRRWLTLLPGRWLALRANFFQV